MIHSYPWYIADWRNSETRLNLNLEERGLYRELLDFCYVERSLPLDERKLARIANCSDEEFQRAWPAVKNLFNESNGRYRHSKVDETLSKLDGYHEQRRQAGIASGERRRNERSNFVAKKGNENRTPQGNPQNEPSHPIPSATQEEPPIPPMQISSCNSCSPAGEHVSDSQFELIAAPTNGTLAAYQGEWFEQWWAIYWRKVSRKVAEKAFRKVVKSPDRFEVVMAATRKQTPAMMAREPEHRPHGGSWLNAERWNDEPSQPARGGSSPRPTVVENVTRIFTERIARDGKPW